MHYKKHALARKSNIVTLLKNRININSSSEEPDSSKGFDYSSIQISGKWGSFDVQSVEKIDERIKFYVLRSKMSTANLFVQFVR